MKFEPSLNEAIMVRRYKRFLADVQLPDGSFETIHCANTGSMHGCVYPALPVFYSISDNPKRKLRGTLELVQSPAGDLICVNTNQANRLVKEALQEGRIEQFKDQTFQSEVPIADESGRFDFGNETTCIEVKSVTYLRDGIGVFPDAKSDRATKHVKALERSLAAGKRAVLLFAVLHTGIDRIAIADDIDPVYGRAVERAMSAGVEVLAYRFDISAKAMTLKREVAFLGRASSCS